MKKLIAVFSIICITVGLFGMPVAVHAASKELCNETFETASDIDLTCSQDGWLLISLYSLILQIIVLTKC